MRTFRSLKVGMNLLHLAPGETGGAETYARRLIPALLETESDLELVLFASREGAPSLRREEWAKKTSIEEVPVRSTGRARRVLAEQTVLPAGLRRRRVDLLHNLFTTAPLVSGVPQVTTILDLIYRRYPEAHAGLRSLGMRVLVPLAARRATRIIAISDATRADVVSFLGVDPGSVDVVHLAAGGPAAVEPEPEDEFRRRYGLGDLPIVLSVSAHRPHKNLERLIDAITLVDGVILVVPGYPTPWESELREHARRAGVADRVRLPGWLTGSELEGLYRAATCMVFPSLAEGFGLPVLEAMARGVPVASSNATSLPEVGGDAALYFDPLDTQAIADAITRLVTNGSLRDRLAAEGRRQAARFSWERVAKETAAVYERALAS